MRARLGHLVRFTQNDGREPADRVDLFQETVVKIRATSLRRVIAVGLVAATAAGTAACATSSDSASEVNLLTHDSFALPQNLVDDFQRETGLKLNIQKSGDAGQLSSVVSLTPGSPKADAVFGIDNTFAARPIEAGALEPYTSPLAAKGAAEFAVAGHEDQLTAVDRGDVCLNVDDAWFENKGVEAPTSIDDLTQPAYRDLTVVMDPATSSPGMGFLLSTIGRFKSKAFDYWRGLSGNGVQVVSGWEQAYNQLFSAGEGHGPKPIVVSYASSPAATPGTSAILDSCFAQIEYVGILKGARNSAGARKLVDFMLSPAVQAALPTAMYVYPVQKNTPMPADWRQRAPAPGWTVRMDPDWINKNREEWLTQWRATVKP
ncbi:thiamine ABC transporter substrate-binding protein [Gordonia malaquae]|uniref:Putative ABC transporter substrate-binding protein n=1 Tax=Gordonia malaquae NBRC 108250 TaxID=1223542 RepID=M3VB59_GORML|nr:thiamine ABC transporter substrate-binding protein [Gordonia malaquae]GAC79693.1 putative ABC transporter substrate-binding protein [Gordonia malaquae NBRC 108250]SED81225.1 thiamine transport system substrate-binding protein [Gordonia malaquae]